MIVLATLLVAGCAVQSGADDDKVGRFLVSPDKYEFYTCEQLAPRAQEMVTRERELQALTAKAETGAGGEHVAAVAYRPDYLQVHGEMNEIRKAAAEKNCGPLPAPGNAAAAQGAQTAR